MNRLLWLLVLALLWPGRAFAHKTSDSYLRLRVADDHLRGTWELALHDLEVAVGLDANEDAAITWGELRVRREAVVEYARSRLRLEADGAALPVRFESELQVDALASGTFAVLRFDGELPGKKAPRSLTIDYEVFFDVDRLHRGLLLLEQGGTPQQAVFNPVDHRLRFDLHSPDPWREFLRFGAEGVWHIWIGYDHVLFLVVLLLPAVLRREPGQWVPVARFGEAFANVVKVVTAFTLAHSLTLTAAALDWVRLPSRLVESAIAASIVVAAVNNLRPVVTHRAWGIAFGFGLVHGFGFAAVLADLGLPRGALVRALVGFNLGVEVGQLAIVSALLPLANAVRHTRFYRGRVLTAGSALVALLGAWWVILRLRGG